MPADQSTRVVRVPSGPDTEYQLRLDDGAVDVRLARRVAPAADAAPGTTGTYEPTAAGFRLNVALVPLFTEALQRLVRREQQAALWRPAPVDTTAGA